MWLIRTTLIYCYDLHGIISCTCGYFHRSKGWRYWLGYLRYDGIRSLGLWLWSETWESSYRCDAHHRRRNHCCCYFASRRRIGLLGQSSRENPAQKPRDDYFPRSCSMLFLYLILWNWTYRLLSATDYLRDCYR